MEEEFYSIIKLVSGEEILSLVSIDENDDDPVLLLAESNYYENSSWFSWNTCKS